MTVFLWASGHIPKLSGTLLPREVLAITAGLAHTHEHVTFMQPSVKHGLMDERERVTKGWGEGAEIERRRETERGERTEKQNIGERD